MKNYAYIICFLVSVLGIQSCSIDQKHVHCVVVSDESNYIGDWLKNGNSIQDGVIETAECSRLDAEIDRSDGNKNGKVRWSSCFAGPDCDEAGVF